jgi:hypothetical protein
VGEDGDGKGFHTGRRQWRTAGLGGGWACAREVTEAGFKVSWRSVKGSWGQPRRRCTRGVAARRSDVRRSGDPMACGGWHADE